MTASRRKLLLIGLLLVSVGLVAWDRLRTTAPGVVSKAVTRPNASHASNSTPAAAEPTVVAALKPRDDYALAGGDAFMANRPPPPVVVAAPVAQVEVRPTAPPLAFTVIGKKLERGEWEVYLAKGDQIFIAKPGVTIADTYRVDAIQPTQMTLTYLPLNETQTLQTGAALND